MIPGAIFLRKLLFMSLGKNNNSNRGKPNISWIETTSRISTMYQSSFKDQSIDFNRPNSIRYQYNPTQSLRIFEIVLIVVKLKYLLIRPNPVRDSFNGTNGWNYTCVNFVAGFLWHLALILYFHETVYTNNSQNTVNLKHSRSEP